MALERAKVEDLVRGGDVPQVDGCVGGGCGEDVSGGRVAGGCY